MLTSFSSPSQFSFVLIVIERHTMIAKIVKPFRLWVKWERRLLFGFKQRRSLQLSSGLSALRATSDGKAAPLNINNSVGSKTFMIPLYSVK